MEIKLVNTDGIQVCLPDSIYNEAIVYKCFYWYGKEFIVEIKKNYDSFVIKLIHRSGNLDFPATVKRINRDLIDYKTRDIVNRETSNVRDLLIAKAFAHSDEFDEIPPGDVHDPVSASYNNLER